MLQRNNSARATIGQLIELFTDFLIRGKPFSMESLMQSSAVDGQSANRR